MNNKDINKYALYGTTEMDLKCSGGTEQHDEGDILTQQHSDISFSFPFSLAVLHDSKSYSILVGDIPNHEIGYRNTNLYLC